MAKKASRQQLKYIYALQKEAGIKKPRWHGNMTAKKADEWITRLQKETGEYTPKPPETKSEEEIAHEIKEMFEED